MRPMAQRCGALAALLRLAATSPPLWRALPAGHSAAPLGRVRLRFRLISG